MKRNLLFATVSLFLTANLFALEISGGYENLWSGKDGCSGTGGFSVSESFKNTTLTSQLSDTYSTWECVLGNAVTFDQDISVKELFNSPLSIDFNSTFTYSKKIQNKFSIDEKEKTITLENLFSPVFFVKAPFDFSKAINSSFLDKAHFIVSPSFGYGGLFSNNGNLHYTFGSPVIPEVFWTGLEIKAFGTTLFTGDFFGNAKILNRKELTGSDEDLAYGSFNLFTAGISNHLEKSFYNDSNSSSEKNLNPHFYLETLSLDSKLLYSFGYLSYEAKLTGNNQGYMFFPYKTYIAKGAGIFQAAGFSLNGNMEFSKGGFSLLFAGLFCPTQSLNNLCWWVYKDSFIFDASSGEKRVSLNEMEGRGLLYIKPEFRLYLFENKTESSTSRLEVKISKPFIIPVGKQIEASEEGSVSQNLVTEYLLSGLKISVSYSF